MTPRIVVLGDSYVRRLSHFYQYNNVANLDITFHGISRATVLRVKFYVKEKSITIFLASYTIPILATNDIFHRKSKFIR